MIDEEVNEELEPTNENPAEDAGEQEAAEPVAEEAPAEEETPEPEDEEAPAEEEAPEPEAEEAPAEEETPEPEDAETGQAEAPETEEAGGEEDSPGGDDGPVRVLFLCTGNSCRSQMAEGLLRSLAPDRFESLSAGSKPADEVHPMALAVMGELEIDISAQQPKSIELFLSGEQPAPNIVISVCAKASEECPAFTGAEVLSMSLPFDDPAEAEGGDEEKLEVFRRVRDEIRETLQQALGL